MENQLSAALYGQVASTLPEQDRITDIRVRYPDEVRFDRDRLAQLPIACPPLRRPTAAGDAHRRPRLRPAGPGGDDRASNAVPMSYGARTSSR